MNSDAGVRVVYSNGGVYVFVLCVLVYVHVWMLCAYTCVRVCVFVCVL
jgi:hypothetical protein